MIREIRLPFDKTQDNSFFLCPIDAPSIPHHTGACTNTLHNTTYTNTNSLQKQNTGTVEIIPLHDRPNYDSPNYENFPTTSEPKQDSLSKSHSSNKDKYICLCENNISNSILR